MKLGFLTLATVHAQGDEPKPAPGKFYTDFENVMSCTEFFARNETFSSFEADDGRRIGVRCVI